jgi:hypothetical protein
MTILPIERRPRLAVAWVPFDMDAPSLFEAVVAAGAQRVASRSDSYEHSTSAEEQAVRFAYEAVEDIVPNGRNVVTDSDSDGMRQAFNLVSNVIQSPRKEVKRREMGELRGATAVVDRLATRGVDVVNVWEQAYHNRIRRGTADGRHTVEARLNHVCDRLAGHAVLGGRDRELDFYGGMRPQRV